MIAAAAENNAIGKDNKLLWHLPDDFKRFKKLTVGHKIIMGRKTFESFPKPLPRRTHIIITRDLQYHVPFEDCIVVHSLEAALDLILEEHVFVIGGGEIYTQAIKIADVIELTSVHTRCDADTYFPVIPLEDWAVTEEVFHEADARHKYAFTFVTYNRKKEGK